MYYDYLAGISDKKDKKYSKLKTKKKNQKWLFHLLHLWTKTLQASSVLSKVTTSLDSW